MIEVQCHREDARLTLYPVGELTADGCESAREQIMGHVEFSRGVREVVLDMRAVSLVDSTGIGLIMGTRIHLNARQIKFRLANPSPPVAEIIAMMNLTAILGL